MSDPLDHLIRGSCTESFVALVAAQDYSNFRHIRVRHFSALLETVDRVRQSAHRAMSDESPQSMRRKSSSTSTARIVRYDHWCASADGSRKLGGLQHRPSGASPDHPQVIDNFPAVVPVTQRELDVIETYLGSLLDDLLKRTH